MVLSVSARVISSVPRSEAAIAAAVSEAGGRNFCALPACNAATFAMVLSQRNFAFPIQDDADSRSSNTVVSAEKKSASSNAAAGPRPKLQKKSSFKEWLQRKRSFTDLFDSEGYTGLSKQWTSLKGKAGGKFGFQKTEGEETGRSNASPLKGRAAMENVIVKQNTSLWTHFYDSYIYLLRLPAHLFTFYCMLAPFLVAMPFTLVYLLDLEGQPRDFLHNNCPTPQAFSSLRTTSSAGWGEKHSLPEIAHTQLLCFSTA